MPRIYQQEDYRSQFEPQAQSVGFNPVRAADNSEAIRQQTAAQIENIKTLATSANRQAELDQSALRVGEAFNAVSYKTLQGLLSLSGTAMKTYQDIDAVKKQIAEEDQYLKEYGFFEERPELEPEKIQQLQQEQIAIDSEAQGTAVVAKELQAQPDLESQHTAHILQENTTYNQLKEAKGNALTAASLHGVFLSEALRNLPEDQLPKTPAEGQILLRELNRQFLRATGMFGADRESQLKLAKQMHGNTLNALPMLMNQSVKMRQEANRTEALGYTSNLVDSGASPQEIWEGVSKRFAYGDVGFAPGFSKASNEGALLAILAEAQQNGNLELIDELRSVQQIPGQAGTELGKTFDHIFDKFQRDTRRQVIEDFNLEQAEEKIQIKQNLDFYYDSPTPENRQKAVEILRAIGTEDALAEADRLSQFGLNYDPQKKFELLELQAKGVEIPEETLKQLLTDGTISPQEYKQFSRGDAAKQTRKVVDDYIKDISDGLKSSMQGTAGPQDLTPEVKAELTIRHQMIQDDLRRLVEAEININPAIATDRAMLAQVMERKTQFLLQQPQYKLQRNPKTGWEFAGEIKTDQRLARITVAPGVQDFSKFKPEELFGKLNFPRSEMDPTKDRFISLAELRADTKRIVEGQNPSNRTRLLAKNLGLSSTALIDSQLRANGMPSLSALQSGQDSNPQLDNLTGDIQSSSQAMITFRGFGFPSKGAAYLAGNLQQESGFNGMRSWDDQGAPAGGIASWRGSRLRAMETHFGRKVTQITEREQLQYLIQDLKKNYPDQYRVFMNPSASPDQLKKASYQYWRYGAEGSRFKYAEDLLNGNSFRNAPSGRRNPSNVRGTRSGYVGSTRVVPTGLQDQQGRDIRLSPEAATAWKKMIKAGMPFSSTHVASSYRSEDDYLRLVKQGYKTPANSRHHHGDAIDAHDATNEWLKKHGRKYGWVLVDYEGSHGGHFEYRPN